MTIEEAIEIIERAIKKLKDRASDGKDDTLQEVARRAKVIADAGGYRAPELELMPEVFRQALEDLETNNNSSFISALEWARYYVIPVEGWDGGFGDAWMRMEAQRLELLRLRIREATAAPGSPEADLLRYERLKRQIRDIEGVFR
ncbi:MAG: hypothetical protein WCJ31_06305 [Planctomycetia bacterium]